MTASLGLQDFLGALRSGNIESAKQIYTNMVPSSPSETMTMRSQTDELTEDKSPRKWREDAATGARQAGANRTGASAISGDNPLGVGAVDINPLTAVPAAMADFRETRERVKQGDAGPFEYGLTAAAIPLAAAPAVGGAAGRVLSRSGKTLDNAATGVGKQMRRMLGQEVSDAPFRLPDEINIGKKIAATEGGPVTRTVWEAGVSKQEAIDPDETVTRINPAVSRERPGYFHGNKTGNKDKIIDEGFTRGGSDELNDAGTSVSSDPSVSLNLFTGPKPDVSNMLIVELDEKLKGQTKNLDPFTYLVRRHTDGNPSSVRKPNVFMEDETFYRKEGGGQEGLRAREPTREERNFIAQDIENKDALELSAPPLSNTEKLMSSTGLIEPTPALQRLLDRISTNADVSARWATDTGFMKEQRQTYKDLINLAKYVHNQQELGKGGLMATIYQIANSGVELPISKLDWKNPAFIGGQRNVAASNLGRDLITFREYHNAFDMVSTAVQEMLDKPNNIKQITDNVVADIVDLKNRFNNKEDYDKLINIVLQSTNSIKNVENTGVDAFKPVVNNLWRQVQNYKDKVVDSFGKLAVAGTAGAAGAGLASGEAEASPAMNMQEMDAVATMPDTDIMDDLKSVYDMINSARTEGTLQDKATKAAIQQRHKQLLEKLIDSALDEEE
jgi:hypothetical protein